MGIYEEFAHFYAMGKWPEYSARMAELLPGVLEHFHVQPHTLLDLACGEGTFAVAMAKLGLLVTGVDLSPQMLGLAREKAERENVSVELCLQDMRSLEFEDRFDMVTCWFDSLNYVLELEDMEKTFAGVSRALKKGGLFVFDVNTIYGLAVGWDKHPCYVQVDTPDMFSICCPHYDFENKTSTLRVIGFDREGDKWTRMDEEHKERGYTSREIRQCLERAGLHELACWATLEEMSEPQPSTERVWFVIRK